ncbi:cytochrome b5 [Plasmodium yoelii yoelii]|nr:cytochrome b5 [Plasmodium yoelii yoelii]
MKTYLIGIKKNSPLYEKNINTKSVNGKIEYIDYFLEEIKEKEPPKTDVPEIVRIKYSIYKKYALLSYFKKFI